jgi:hypothetical protein
VDTKIYETSHFSNVQEYRITDSLDVENVTQTTTIDSTTTTRDGSLTLQVSKHLTYPLVTDITFVEYPDGNFAQKTKISQKYESTETEKANGVPIYYSMVTNAVAPTDTLLVNSSFEITGNEDQSSSQDYFSFDTINGCYSRSLTEANNVLTGVTNGAGCTHGTPAASF